VKVTISSSVRVESIIIQDSIEGERRGYGLKFAESLETTIELITQFPKANRLRFRNSRAVMIPRFSYILVYKVYPDEILVQKLIHVKRSLRKQYKA
jgi:hypothetical protein